MTITPFADSAVTTDLSAATARQVGETTTIIPVIEESLVVEKRLVDQGGWRVSKQVSSRNETVDQPLASQQVSVERRAVGEMLATMEPPAPRQEGDTWIVPVIEEVLVTEKRLRLIEEIRITCTVSTRHQPQQVALRSEEVTIERLEPGHPPAAGSL